MLMRRETLLAEAEVFGRCIAVGVILGLPALAVSSMFGYPGVSARNYVLVVLGLFAATNILFIYLKLRRPGTAALASMAATDYKTEAQENNNDNK